MINQKAVTIVTIDERLLDPNGELEISEDLNRILALIDALEARIEALETPTG